MFKVLVVEDDRELNSQVCTYLKQNGYEAVGCLNANEAFNTLYNDLFDLKSLVYAVEKSDAPSYPAACDAGTERTYAVQYDRDGNAEAILLGMEPVKKSL